MADVSLRATARGIGRSSLRPNEREKAEAILPMISAWIGSTCTAPSKSDIAGGQAGGAQPGTYSDRELRTT